MRKLFVDAVVVLAVLAAGADRTFAALVDSPMYASWAKLKPGAKVAYETSVTMPGMAMTQDVVHELKSVTPEKVVIEITTVMNMGGFRNEQKATQEIAAKVEENQQFLPPDVKGEVKKVGNETLKVAGQEYACEVWEYSGEAGGSSAKGKVWRNEKIPGGVVQTETNMQTPMGAGVAKMVLKSVTP